MAKRDDGPPDAREAELVENMVLDAMEYVHGRGTDNILRVLRETEGTAHTVAEAAYRVVKRVAKKNEATARVAMDMDMMLGVATETIDMVVEVAQAANTLNPGANLQSLKGDALLGMSVMHGTALGAPTTDQKAQAATDMRDYMADEGTRKAFDYVASRANEQGLNVNDMVRAGNQLLYGSRTPVEDRLKAGITEGLRDGTIEAPIMPGYQPEGTTTPMQPGANSRGRQRRPVGQKVVEAKEEGKRKQAARSAPQQQQQPQPPPPQGLMGAPPPQGQPPAAAPQGPPQGPPAPP